jgi:hypothetical protein
MNQIVPATRLDRLTPGQRLRLPFVSQPTTIVLKPGVTRENALARLGAATAATQAGTELLWAEPDPELDLLGPIDAADPGLARAGCHADATLPERWPFDAEAVRAAIEAGVAHRRPAAPTVLRIADTGVSGIGEPGGFPRDLLAPNPHEREGDLVADRDPPPGNGYKGDRFGISADFDGAVAPLRGQVFGWHGWEVAHLALGGRAFREATPQLGQMIRLNFARLFTVRLGQRPRPDAPMLASALTDGLPVPHIVNASVGGTGPVHGLRRELASLVPRGQLLVLAAGNERVSLREARLFPATYAHFADARPAMIVVGGHGPTGERTDFSNHGVDYVDLLAPSCRLRPEDASAGATLNGTSFAAPLVSFTAAVIRSLMIQPEPARIRERFHTTVHRLPGDAAGEVTFGGRLDMRAALRLFDDLMRLPDGTLLPGRWQEEEPVAWCLDRPPLRPARVARVWVEAGTATAPLRLRILARDVNGVVRDEPMGCRAAPGHGPTLLLEGGERRVFEWAEVAAFIPALDLADRRNPVPGAPVAAMPLIPIAGGGPQPSEFVRSVQEALAQRGLSPGARDGRLGPATEQAIRDFQRIRNERPTGVLSGPQLRMLLTR